jgi:Spy/CpxP family protein refolding chaperone
MAAMLKLQQIMQDPTPREPEVRAILDSLDQKRKETENLKQRQWEEQRAMLTPVQQARYLMYLMDIKKEARSLKRGPGPAVPLGKGPREVPVTRPTR